MTVEKDRSRQRWMAVLLLVTTFVSGALVGVVLDRTVLADDLIATELNEPPSGPRGGPRPSRNVFADGGPLQDRLDLSEDQRAQIDQILADDRAKAATVMAQMQPRLRARYDSTTTAILEVLTPEQQESFAELRSEREAQLRRRFGGDRRGRGPGGQR